jgi:hypothetical protein
MEEQKEILQRSDDPHSVDPLADGHLSAAVRYSRRSLLIHSLVLAVTIPALLWSLQEWHTRPTARLYADGQMSRPSA